MLKKEGTSEEHSHTEVTHVVQSQHSAEKKYENLFHKAMSTRNGVCPVRDIIARISDKWSMLAILSLGDREVLRFNEMKQLIGDVSQRMLTVTLRNLEKDGLVLRTFYAQIPPKVEYRLTPLGKSLLEEIAHLSEWAEKNAATIIQHRNH